MMMTVRISAILFRISRSDSTWASGTRTLTFHVLVQGVFGNDVYFLYGNFAYETQLRGFNSYAKILDRWTPDKYGY